MMMSIVGLNKKLGEMKMNKKYGKKTGAKFLTYIVNRKAKEFTSKWFPLIEFGGEMVMIQGDDNETLRFDTEKEAKKEAKEFLKKMKEKYPEDFAS